MKAHMLVAVNVLLARGGKCWGLACATASVVIAVDVPCGALGMKNGRLDF